MKKKSLTYPPRLAVIFLLLLFSFAFALNEWHTLHFHDSEKLSDGCDTSSNTKTTHWHDENTHHHCDGLCGTLSSNFETPGLYVLRSNEKIIPQKSFFSFPFCFSSSAFSFSRGRAPPYVFIV